MSQEDHSEKGGYYIFIFSMLTVVIFMIYISFMHPGVAIDQNEKTVQEESK